MEEAPMFKMPTIDLSAGSLLMLAQLGFFCVFAYWGYEDAETTIDWVWPVMMLSAGLALFLSVPNARMGATLGIPIVMVVMGVTQGEPEMAGWAFFMLIIVGSLSYIPALAMGDLSFGWLDGLALFVGVAATLIELIADEQMRAFVRQRTPGAHMESGLWRYSRHPNYFGEMLFWISLWLFALAAAPAYWWTGIGVLAMLLMFVFASIPMMDTRSRERRPGYADYEARTSSLILWPPKGS